MKDNKFKIDFIGIGVQRAGTTWIAECLSEHPQVCMSNPKEIHFFGSEKFKFGLNWYKKHFSPKLGQIIGEFDAGYFESQDAAQQIKSYFPDVKIIICLRNPIDKAFSNYLSVASFEAKDQNFEQWLSLNPHVIERGKYSNNLKNYLDLFSKQNILILFYEDIAKNPKQFIKNIFSFLEIDESFIPDKIERKNESKTYRLPFVKKTIGRIIIKIRSYKFGVSLANALREVGFKKLFIFIDKINSRPIENYPTIEDATLQKLKKIYLSDIENLEKLINKDLSAWK